MAAHSKTNLQDIPDSLKAEKWLTPYVFLSKGKLWEIKPNGEVVPVKEEIIGKQ